MAQLGKQYPGQLNVPIKTEEMASAESAAQDTSEGTITMDVYFMRSGIRNPVMQAAMQAFTLTRSATLEAWIAIFKTF